MGIEFYDISNTNCWMVYLMPFDAADRGNYNLVYNKQQLCIDKHFVGMGWDIPCFEQGTPMTTENAAIYQEKYRETYPGASVSEDAINGFLSIKKGDYVITRIKNGHYYVGKISSEGAKYIYKEGDPLYSLFSWGAEVEEWAEYANDCEVPSEIVGRFSQRLHSTIQRILPYRQKMLVISMYEKKYGNGSTGEISNNPVPKVRIGKSNFVRCLNYKELEDLVALYITNKHSKDGYKLLPSSCKVSQQNYEFIFRANGKKPITCQVKNQQEIDIEHYLNENSYEKIYVFSGKWDETAVKEKRNLFKQYEHIYIISPEELWEVLKVERFLSSAFYDFDNEPRSPYQLKLEGYTKCDRPAGEKKYSIDDDYICFVNKDGLFYSAEFDSLVLSWDIFGGTNYDRGCIETILRDLNAG